MNITFLDLSRVNAPHSAALDEVARRVIASGRYIGGPEVAEFERQLSLYQQGGEVVGVSNGLDALRLILEGFKVMGRLKPGDEILVPANTYVASILAISQAGLVPVLVEPSERTLNLDTSLLEKAVTRHTRALMTVHLYGTPCWDEALMETATKHGLLVIEDNAQAMGSQASIKGYNNLPKCGSLGHAAAFSFYPTKNLGALGDAGAVLTHDQELASVIRALANYGSDRRYHNLYVGFNCRMDPLQAAFLAVKLPSLDTENDHRREIAAIYDTHIHHPLVTLHPVEIGISNYHQYVITTPHRDTLREHLAAQGVATDIHYPTPPHLQPCYKTTLGGERLPITEKLARQVLSLPIAPYLSRAEALYVAEAINNF